MIIQKLNIYFSVKVIHTAVVVPSSGFHRPMGDLTYTTVHYDSPNTLAYRGNKSCQLQPVSDTLGSISKVGTVA